MREAFIQAILEKLDSNKESLSERYESSSTHQGKTYPKHVAIHSLLPEALVSSIANKFPSPSAMRLMNSFREKKRTGKQFQDYDPVMLEISLAFQDPRVVALVSEITNIKDAVVDDSFYAGGLSAMEKGHFLNPHIDNSHEGSRRYYRVLNLLYYVSPDWKEDFGGSLELWDKKVQNRIVIPSLYNQLVLMETNRFSWHSVNKVMAPTGSRNCVSNYYFSKHPPLGKHCFHITSFSARPEEKLKRLHCRLDNFSRSLLRKIVPSGVGKEDVYTKHV